MKQFLPEEELTRKDIIELGLDEAPEDLGPSDDEEEGAEGMPLIYSEKSGRASLGHYDDCAFYH